MLILTNCMSILNPISIIHLKPLNDLPVLKQDSLQRAAFPVIKVNDDKNHISAAVSPKYKQKKHSYKNLSFSSTLSLPSSASAAKTPSSLYLHFYFPVHIPVDFKLLCCSETSVVGEY